MVHRALLPAMLCLTAGLLAQTAAAWLLFVYADYTGGTGVINTPLLKPGEVTATGFVVPADWESQTLVRWWGPGKTRETVSEGVWMGSRLFLAPGGRRQATYNGFSAGWPCRSLWGSDYLTAGVQAQIPRPLVPVPAWIKAGAYKVPVEPRWPGLLVNTLLFSLPFGVGFVAWTALRRARRLRRGQCLRCGYAVGALPRCPECGSPHAQAPAEEAAA